MQIEPERIDDTGSLLEGVRSSVVGDAFWFPYLTGLLEEPRHAKAVHLGIFNQPYLDSLLEGSKTVESRFSSVRCAPVYCVRPGDVVLVKRSGGPIIALFLAGEVWNYRLTSRNWVTIRERFGEAISPASGEFWRDNESATYATLIGVERVRRVEPISWNKSDRRGWVVLHRRRSTNPWLFE
jgi:hypothetical protein